MIPGIVASWLSGALPPADAFAAEVVADAPTLWWRMNESSGASIADESGDGRTGAFGAGTGYTRGVSGLVGGPNKAVEVTSRSAYFRSDAGLSALDMATNKTMALVVKINAGQAAGAILGLNDGGDPTGTSGSRDRMLYLNTEGQLVAGLWTGALSTIVTPFAVNDGMARIIHLAFGSDASEGTELYVNGASVGMFSAISVDTAGDRFLYGGLLNTSGWPLGSASATPLGVYDEVLIFNSRLSASRILAQAEAAGLA